MACRESTEIEDRQNSAMQQTDNLTNKEEKGGKLQTSVVTGWEIGNRWSGKVGV